MIICRFVLPTGGVCNFENPDDAVWCGNCGEKLEWYGEEAVQTGPTGVVVVPDEEPRPAGLVERVKGALHIGGEGEAGRTVTTGVADAPVVVPDASPSTPPAAEGRGTASRTPVGDSMVEAASTTNRAPAAVPPTDQPKATVPTEEMGAPKPITKRPRAPKPKAGDLICGACGLPNDPVRNFCARCGASLQEAQTARVPWWRRIFARRRSVSADDVGAGDVARPTKGRAPRPVVKNTVAKFAMFVLFGTVIAGFAIPSLRSTALRWFESARGALFPKYVQVNTVSASSSSEVGHCTRVGAGVNPKRDHCALDAFDEYKDTFWAEGVSGLGVHQYVIAVFQQPSDLKKITILSGAPDFKSFSRPLELNVTVRNAAGVDLRFEANGKRVRSVNWQLDDTPDEQTLSLDAAGVKSVKLEIAQAHRGAEFDQTAIRDIEFWTID